MTVTPLFIRNHPLSGTEQFQIDSNLLSQLLPASPEGAKTRLFHLPLPDGAVISLHTEYAETTVDGYALYGVQPDNRAIYAFIGVTGDSTVGFHLAGSVYLEEQNYIIEPAGAGQVTISPAPPLTELFHLHAGEIRTPVATSTDGLPLLQPVGEDNTSPAEIAILALYPAALETAIAGGVAGITAVVNKMQIALNIAFRNTGIAAQGKITVDKLDVLKQTEVTALLKEVVIFDWSKNAFVRGPAWQAVSELRDARKADVVALLAPTLGDDMFYGLTSCIPQPASASHSELDYATMSVCAKLGGADMVFAHEFGHLLGGLHSRHMQKKGLGNPQYDFARGYISKDGSWGTLMANGETGTTIPAWSATDRQWKGETTGVPAGQPDAADCASLFRLSVHQVSRYRSHTAPVIPGNRSGDTG
ncbi:hypothetical protein [Cedecea neteri]|uniref:Uncharacterized protein n=2 Tax=Cedecea neteri TaxID=158822 RepID=A0A291E664_9ENTR|nr:hypothetical protein [Cedecea neteri]ATF95378.1 hypothetical protein CO704_25120 [Cedecea neteri]